MGLVTFDERMRDYLPPRHRAGHLRRLMMALERRAEGKTTNVNEPLRRVAELARKRGLIVLASDLLTPMDELERNLARLAMAGHEVVLMQALDPNELAFDFHQASLFHDMESQQDIYLDPDNARADYQSRLADHCRGAESICQQAGRGISPRRHQPPARTGADGFSARARPPQQTHSPPRPGARVK